MPDATPPTLYHGTARELLSFVLPEEPHRHPDGLGCWFTEDLPTAWDFADRKLGQSEDENAAARVYVCNLDVKTPYTVNEFEALKVLVRKHKSSLAAREWLLGQGYDCIIVDRSFPGLPDTARDFILLDSHLVRIEEVLLERNPSPANQI